LSESCSRRRVPRTNLSRRSDLPGANPAGRSAIDSVPSKVGRDASPASLATRSTATSSLYGFPHVAEIRFEFLGRDLDREIANGLPLVLQRALTRRLLERAKRAGTWTDDDYAVCADWYLQALQEDPRRPLVVMLERYRKTYPAWKVEQVRDRVKEARRRGFLTAGRQGTAGAEPTQRLLDWRLQRAKDTEPRKRDGRGKRR
jgi:hypothetical protein